MAANMTRKIAKPAKRNLKVAESSKSIFSQLSMAQAAPHKDENTIPRPRRKPITRPMKRAGPELGFTRGGREARRSRIGVGLVCGSAAATLTARVYHGKRTSQDPGNSRRSRR